MGYASLHPSYATAVSRGEATGLHDDHAAQHPAWARRGRCTAAPCNCVVHDDRGRNGGLAAISEVEGYLAKRAQTKGVELDELVNRLLKREIEIIEAEE